MTEFKSKHVAAHPDSSLYGLINITVLKIVLISPIHVINTQRYITRKNYNKFITVFIFTF